MSTSKKHFNLIAKEWDTPDKIKTAEHYSALIKDLLKRAKFSKVLEVGCGTGLLGGHFLNPENQYIGLDSAEEMLNVFKKKFESFKNAKSYRVNLDNDEIPEEGFDLVISSMAFHHLKNPTSILKKVAQKALKRCYFVIIDLDKEDGTFHPDPKGMGVHHQGFSREDIQAWGKGVGLQFLFHDIVHIIEKNNRKYSVFLSLFQKL